MDLLASGIVIATGLYLMGLGGVAILAPRRAEAFLGGFARSATTHYLELAIRIAVGAALIAKAPVFPLAQAFLVVGWVLCVSTLGLALLPWRWHRRFAGKVVPRALPYLPWIAAVSLAAGAALVAVAVMDVLA